MLGVLDLLNQKLVLCLSIYVHINESPFMLLSLLFVCKEIGKLVFFHFLLSVCALRTIYI